MSKVKAAVIAETKEAGETVIAVKTLDPDDVVILTPGTKSVGRGVRISKVYVDPGMRTHEARVGLMRLARAAAPGADDASPYVRTRKPRSTKPAAADDVDEVEDDDASGDDAGDDDE
jgi:hypothetical protein